MFFSSANMHYRLAGMPMDLSMKVGMGLIIAGLVHHSTDVAARAARRTHSIDYGRSVRYKSCDGTMCRSVSTMWA